MLTVGLYRLCDNLGSGDVVAHPAGCIGTTAGAHWSGGSSTDFPAEWLSRNLNDNCQARVSWYSDRARTSHTVPGRDQHQDLNTRRRRATSTEKILELLIQRFFFCCSSRNQKKNFFSAGLTRIAGHRQWQRCLKEKA